ncbi:DUF418 domain-containing protein [Schaalia sp. ZJ405]|uniref:DUF418 domain-containing protein n=1 Tax=Schaalia sp. ZJ405 TaxID=2709403 RepID=UPI0013EC057F|nr:DUF418 domain-containing protein [Schaalia sp. ZJ405]QPK80707.1 DUF418 domain-containing protein [Schaalia sp. ZJ405]
MDSSAKTVPDHQDMTRQSSTSFTGRGSTRYPAPDVARGAMLMLIAVANVPFWLKLFPNTPESTTVDQWWVFLRALLIDHRIYPLFSLLFGFGLMFMLRRRTDAHVSKRTEELDRNAPGMTPEARASWIAGFTSEAMDDSRKLIRRRGWWMLLFGLVHSLIFFGDIIGTYGLVAAIFAGTIVQRRWRLMTGVSIGIVLVSCALFISQEFAVSALGKSVDNLNTLTSLSWMISPWFPLLSVGMWVIGTLSTLAFSMVIPAVFIGVKVGETTLLTHPENHRRFLFSAAVGGLTLGMLGGLPHALTEAGFLSAEPFIGAMFLHEFSGIAGAIGWLALFALLAGPASRALSGWRQALSAVGRRSMTAYVGQTVCFAVIFAIAGAAGARGISQVVGAVIGVSVWVLILLACVVMDGRGRRRGPLEVLLRSAVARSASATVLPPIPRTVSSQESEEGSSIPSL